MSHSSTHPREVDSCQRLCQMDTLEVFKAEASNWYIIIFAHILLAEAHHMVKSSISELGVMGVVEGGSDYFLYSTLLQ